MAMSGSVFDNDTLQEAFVQAEADGVKGANGTEGQGCGADADFLRTPWMTSSRRSPATVTHLRVSAFSLLRLEPMTMGNSVLDLQSRFAGFFSYDLPLGKSGSRLYEAAVSNLRLNALGFWQTGSPFTVISTATLPDRSATINLPTVTTDKPSVVTPIKSTGSLLTCSRKSLPVESGVSLVL